MSDRRTLAVSLAAAVVIVGGGIYAVLKQASPIVATTPAPSPAFVAPTPAVPPPAASAAPAGPTIFRCKVRGSVVYSDSPCGEGGKLVDVQPTRGYEAPRGSAKPVPVAVARTSSPTAGTTPKSDGSRATQCQQIDEMIAWIDAAARQGGTISYMEDLKERRRKLVDRKYELRC